MKEFKEWVKDEEKDLDGVLSNSIAQAIFNEYLESLDNVDLDFLVSQTESARGLIQLGEWGDYVFSTWLMNRIRGFIGNQKTDES